MEPAFFWRLSRPHRPIQTTLSATASRTLPANESAAARIWVWLSMELQGSEPDGGDTQVNLVMSNEVNRCRGVDMRYSTVVSGFAGKDRLRLKPAEPRKRKSVARAIRRPAGRIDVP